MADTTNHWANLSDAARTASSRTSHVKTVLRTASKLNDTTVTAAGSALGEKVMYARSTKYLGRCGTVLTVTASAAGQLARDADSDLPTDEQAARAAYRASATTAAATAGGAAGSAVAAAALALAVPGAGPILAATVGTIGAMAGGGAATEAINDIVDRTIDDVGTTASRWWRKTLHR